MKRISFSICITLFILSSFHTKLTNSLTLRCDKSELLCGKNICYDPTTQNCTETKVVQCTAECNDKCYDPTTEQCLNETICRTNEQLCLSKYSFRYWDHQCYNPLYQACLNHIVCDHPSETCNNQCLGRNQVCVENTTICNVSSWLFVNKNKNQMKLCNAKCYNSEIYKCDNGSIQCIDSNCSGRCYNSSSHQCLNGTVCAISEQLCSAKYNIYGSVYAVPTSECYDPSLQACFNNTVCIHPHDSCNQHCLQFDQVCVNNATICKVSDWSYEYGRNQIQLCNGTCYDSALEQCIDGVIQCFHNNCSGKCYNSSQQCFNGTICNQGEQVCDLKYGSSRYQCYNTSTQACLANSICDLSRSCNQRCLSYNEICVNNTTVCSVKGTYQNASVDQIKLCNGVCYNSTVAQCVDEYVVRCINDPSRQNCKNSSNKHQPAFALLMSILMVICATLSF